MFGNLHLPCSLLKPYSVSLVAKKQFGKISKSRAKYCDYDRSFICRFVDIFWRLIENLIQRVFNEVCKHIKKIRTSQGSILTNSCTELKFFPVSIVYFLDLYLSNVFPQNFSLSIISKNFTFYYMRLFEKPRSIFRWNFLR